MSKDNSKQWSSATPGYILFLVDQSGSMNEPYAEGKNKATFTALVINRTINELINTNMDGDKVKDRVFITIIGYGDSIKNIQSQFLSAYADKPIRIEKMRKKISDGAGGLVEIEEELPVFVEPVSEGFTPMGHAFEYAKQLIEGWLQKKPDHPAPVVINVSDGLPYDGFDIDNEAKKAAQMVSQIMAVESSDGHPLIFNAHIGEGTPETGYEEAESELPSPEAKFLFTISSRIPEAYKTAAKKFGINVKPESRGFVSNAKPDTLIKFINFGSSGGSDKNH
jgi:uncharacterized protein YegL